MIFVIPSKIELSCNFGITLFGYITGYITYSFFNIHHSLFIIKCSYIFGFLRRGNKPSCLPRNSKLGEAIEETVRRMSNRKTLKTEEPPV